jgi:hypothetical protein
VSSANSGDQWDLRCLVREKIMVWLQQEHPEALPVTRVMLDRPAATTEPEWAPEPGRESEPA